MRQRFFLQISSISKITAGTKKGPKTLGSLKRAITLYLSYINIDGSNPIWPISPKRAETVLETTYALIMSLILSQEIYNNK